MKFAYLLNFFIIVNCIHVVKGISFTTKYKNYKRNNLNAHKLINHQVDKLRPRFSGLKLYQKYTNNSFVGGDFTSHKNTTNGFNIQLASNQFFGSYALPMEIGGQKFFMVINTLAPTFWIQSSQCQDEFCAINTFNSSNATSFYDSGKSFADKVYPISGEIVASDINIAGEKAKNVFFILVDAPIGIFPGSGVIGMGRNLSQGYPISNSTPSPILALYQQEAIKNKLYSLYLGRIPNPFTEPDAKPELSLLTLGGIDTTLYTEDINYFSVQDTENWEIDLDDVIINGKKLGIKGRKIILNTGFPNIAMPAEDSTAINTLIPDTKLLESDYMLPCNTSANVSLIIGGVEYFIKSKDLANGYFTTGPALPPEGFCMSAIYGSTDKGIPWYLGGTFFHTIYVVFDYENSKVGLAQAVPRKKLAPL